MESFLYTPCKGTDIKACIVSNMVKHSKYVGVHWGFCAVFFALTRNTVSSLYSSPNQ